MVYLLGGFAAAAGILSGIDQSIISGASIGMNKSLKLTSHEASFFGLVTNASRCYGWFYDNDTFERVVWP